MLHALADDLLYNEERAWDLSELRKGPYYPISESNRAVLTKNRLGGFYLQEVEATSGLFKKGRIEESKRNLAKAIAVNFEARLPDVKQSLDGAIIETVLKFIDQIDDDLCRHSNHELVLGVSDVARLVRLYWLHSTMAAWLSGLWQPIPDRCGLIFEPSEKYNAALRRSIFARLWEDSSYASYVSFTRQCIVTATRGQFGKQSWVLHREILDLFAEQILDRFFFINSRFLQHGQPAPIRKHAKQIARWLAAVHIGQICGVALPNDEGVFESNRLDQEALEKMLAHTKNNASPDRGVIVSAGIIHYGDSHFAHVCAQYHALIAVGDNGAKSGNEQAVGDWFEKGYAHRLLGEREISDDFIVMPGHQSVDKSLKYDYDLMLYDRRRDILYFIQLKYRFRKQSYYWSDGFQEFFGGFKQESRVLSPSPIWKGIKQLVGLRRVLADTRVRDQVNGELRKKSIAPIDLTPDRVRFLLVHTITQFDFALVDGIALYEFNTFRGLVQKGQVGFEIKPDQEQLSIHSVGRSMPLDAPDEAIKILSGEVDRLPIAFPEAIESFSQRTERSLALRYRIAYFEPGFSILGKKFFRRTKYACVPVT